VAWAGPVLSRKAGNAFFTNVAIVLQLASLALFKYVNFLVEIAGSVLGMSFSPPSILLPIGISFFTFQLVSYLIDTKRAKIEPYPLKSILLYISFFPHLIAGPIVRHNELLPQFDNDPLRVGLAGRLGKGATLFIIGMAKKVLIADALARIADPIFSSPSTVSFGSAWSGALAFTFQLFLDFSAYSEMAIGLALMFGLLLPSNFETPYRSLDLRDFWRRWHITLSLFLRDYVYIPLGGNRHGAGRYVFATMLTMSACGLWHGAGWTFVLWGVFHGIGLLLCTYYQRWGRPLPAPIAWSVTMLFVIVGWVLFRSPTVADTFTFLAAMTGARGFSGTFDGASTIALAAAISVVMPSSHDLLKKWLVPNPLVASALTAGFVYLVLVVGGGQPVSFIYFQF
jgi:alginate O-acetyltransferase complex protein AlgI